MFIFIFLYVYILLFYLHIHIPIYICVSKEKHHTQERGYIWEGDIAKIKVVVKRDFYFTCNIFLHVICIIKIKMCGTVNRSNYIKWKQLLILDMDNKEYSYLYFSEFFKNFKALKKKVIYLFIFTPLYC